MTQSDFATIDPNTKNGTELASDLNAFRDAQNTLHRGASTPSYSQGGMLWVDEAGGPTAWQVTLNDGTDDIVLLTVNTTANTVALPTLVGTLSISGDTDGTHIIGLVKLGTTAPDVAAWAHFDRFVTAGAALRQTTAGLTIVGAPTGQSISLRINDVEQMVLNSTAVTISGSIAAENGSLSIGVDDTTQGLVKIYGNSANAGAVLQIYNPANLDTTYEFYQHGANGSNYNFGPNTATNAFQFSGTGNFLINVGNLTVATASVFEAGLIINEDGLNSNFRVESDTVTDALLLDADGSSESNGTFTINIPIIMVQGIGKTPYASRRTATLDSLGVLTVNDEDELVAIAPFSGITDSINGITGGYEGQEITFIADVGDNILFQDAQVSSGQPIFTYNQLTYTIFHTTSIARSVAVVRKINNDWSLISPTDGV